MVPRALLFQPAPPLLQQIPAATIKEIFCRGSMHRRAWNHSMAAYIKTKITPCGLFSPSLLRYLFNPWSNRGSLPFSLYVISHTLFLKMSLALNFCLNAHTFTKNWKCLNVTYHSCTTLADRGCISIDDFGMHFWKCLYMVQSEVCQRWKLCKKQQQSLQALKERHFSLLLTGLLVVMLLCFLLCVAFSYGCFSKGEKSSHRKLFKLQLAHKANG